MKKVLAVIFAVVVLAASAGYYFYYLRKQDPVDTGPSASMVLNELVQGNERFVAGEPRQHNYAKQIKQTKYSQKPEAVVLACMDSRSIPELAFDQGVGHIFTIRVAGNVVNQDILGSMEYGTKVVGAKLIVVLGHTHCGAVGAACKGVALGNLTDLLKEIKPAVETVKARAKENVCESAAFVDEIARQNVLNMKQMILKKSDIIAELVKEEKVRLVGGMYDVRTGKVTFF